MDDFLLDFSEDRLVKPKKVSKGFGFKDSEEVEEPEIEVIVDVETPVEIEDSSPEPEEVIEKPSTVKRHDHSIRPMRRTKPVPKRGEKAATRVRR